MLAHAETVWSQMRNGADDSGQETATRFSSPVSGVWLLPAFAQSGHSLGSTDWKSSWDNP